MPIFFQRRILRRDLRDNPDSLYLFGENEARTGFGGQAKEMRGEPNAIGIRTKRLPSDSHSAYWIEDAANDGTAYRLMIDADLAQVIRAIERRQPIIIPEAGLGTGLARLETYAPRTFAHLQHKIKQLVRLAEHFDNDYRQLAANFIDEDKEA